MDKLPAYWPVQAALIWIATRNLEACGGAFEAGDDEVEVSVRDFGLSVPALTIAKYRQTGPLTVKSKAANLVEVDENHVRCTAKAPETSANDYEFFGAERELLHALAAGEITSYSIDAGNKVCEIEPVLWLGRQFKDELLDNRFHVVAVAPARDPLRDIYLKRADIERQWPPEGGRKRGPKGGIADHKRTWCVMAEAMLDNGEVEPKHGAATKIANRIWEQGYRDYEPGTIADAIRKTVKDRIKKHESAV